jgi:NADH-quinone oxidoreductase subunit J
VSAHAVIFILVAVLAVFSAVMVITPGNPVHSALWLILNLMSVAVMYYLLNAPFLMAVQLIVYAGAIVVLFLFVVMLLSSKGESGKAHPHLAWLRPAAFVSAAIFLIAIVAVARYEAAKPFLGITDSVIGDPASIGRKLYTTWLLPFETTSILLLAALVGAMYLARHTGRGEADDYSITEGDNV